MKPNRFKYDPTSKKYVCPACQKRRFVRFVDCVNGNYLPDRYGKCDRLINCGYSLHPANDGYGKDHEENTFPEFKPTTNKQKPEAVFIDRAVFKEISDPERYSENALLKNLTENIPFPFEWEDVQAVAKLYSIGTVVGGNYMHGATGFPYIDFNGNIRAIQIKSFDSQSHTKRTDWIHSMIAKHYTRGGLTLPDWLDRYNKQEGKVSCLFGENLLSRFPRNPVFLFEAPKSAILAALYFGLPRTQDDFLCLGVFNLSSFKYERLRVLQGRRVIVFPDLSRDGSAFKLWSSRLEEIKKRMPGTNFKIDRLLEDHANDKQRREGEDLADELLRHNWKAFRKPQKAQNKPSEDVKPVKVVHAKNELETATESAENGEGVQFFKPQPIGRHKARIESLERADWSGIQGPLKLNDFTQILDPEAFRKSSILITKNYNDIRFEPYLNRLEAFNSLEN